MDNKGITLMSLIIVIIVMLILAGVSISGILNAGTVDIAKEVAFKSEAKDIKDAWETKIIGIDSTFLDYADVTDILSGLNADEEVLNKLEIQSGELVYKNEECTQEEKEWFEQVGIFGGVDIVADIKTNVRVLSEEIEVVKEQGIDAVFALDASGSMYYNYSSSNKSKRMAIAEQVINSTAQKIIERNEENRIGLVTFGSKTMSDSNILIPLDRWIYRTNTKKIFHYRNDTTNERAVLQTYTNNKNSTTKKNTRLLKKANGTPISVYERTANQGTYIQGGGYKAYKMLISPAEKKNNVPVIFLVTDGMPMEYYNVYENGSGFKDAMLTKATRPSSSDSKAKNIGENLILTMMYIKYHLPNCRIYTMNIADFANQLDREYAKLILNPNDITINTAKNTTATKKGNESGLSVANFKKMGKQVEKWVTNSPDKPFYYANGFSIGALSPEELEDVFNNFITDIEMSLEKQYTVKENLEGILGVHEINTDNLTFTTTKGPDGKTEDGTTREGTYYFILAEEDYVKVKVKAGAYKKTVSAGETKEKHGESIVVEESISVQDVKDGVEPNLYYLDGTIKWNARGSYKETGGIAQQALESVVLPNDNYVAEIEEIVLELPVRVDKFVIKGATK